MLSIQSMLEKAIAELTKLSLAHGDASPRLDAVRDSLRALVEAQKSAKPADAAERLATQLDALRHWAAPWVRALGREHAAERAVDAGVLAQVQREAMDLRKALDARVAELSEAHAAHDKTRIERNTARVSRAAAEERAERHNNARIAAEAKANELAAERDELRRLRDAVRVEATRLREALKQTGYKIGTSQLCWCYQAEPGVRCQDVLLCQQINAVLSDKGSGADPASGSQGASSASPGSQVDSEPASPCPHGCETAEEHARHSGEQDLSIRLDALAAELAKTDVVVRAHVESMPPQTRAVVDAMRAKGWKP